MSGTYPPASAILDDVLPHLTFRAKIDALNYTAPKRIEIARPPGPHCRSHGNMGFPVNSPVKDDISRTADRPVVYLEVAVDARPANVILPMLRADARLRDRFMRETYNLLTRSVYPYSGPGIPQCAPRSCSKNKHGKLVWITHTLADPFTHDVFDHPTPPPHPESSLYFGYRGTRRAHDPAQVTVYWKRTDTVDGESIDIPPDRQVVRIEVRLQAQGCRAAGLDVVGDLLGYKFRRNLAPYFHMLAVNRVEHGLFERMAPRMRQPLTTSLTRYIRNVVATSGAYALIEESRAFTGKSAAHALLNEAIRDALDYVVRVRPDQPPDSGVAPEIAPPS